MTDNVTRARIVLGVLVSLVAAGALVAAWVARAQEGQAGEGPLFTGRSEALDTERVRISRRWFEAGARSAWHSHAGGQLLFVEEGRARTQKRGAAMRELGQGESDYTGPNVEHWHGAVPDMEFTQVAVAFGGATQWLEHVTDDEYDGR